MKYDVIIIGAGPAGTTTGYHLAKAGFSVMILEAEKLPRYKPCAGAIAARTLDILDFDVSSVLERVVSKLYFTYKLERGHLFAAEAPLAYMVMRDRFDYLLAEKAIHAGAEVIQGTKATDVEIRNDGIIITASGREFRGQIVVGADGARSIVAKVLGLSKKRRMVVAVHSEVFVDSSTLDQHCERLWIDIGSVPSGYAWLFPKGANLSIGVGAFQKKARGLKTYFWQCLNTMIPNYRSVRVYVHPMTIWGGKYRLAAKRVMLVGEAAGIVDPLTGEGIYYAIRSGIIAAQVISQCLSQGQYDMTGYELAIRSKLGRSLRTSMFLSTLFYAYPRATHRFGLCNDRMNAFFSEMMQKFEGRSYMDFCKNIL